LVSAIGVIVDICIAYFLASVLGVPLWIAATIGFILAATANYAGHELWTFRGGERRLSGVRSLQYLGVAGLTLATRLLVLDLLVGRFGTNHLLAIIIGATGISFLVNFSMSKFMIFRRATAGGPRAMSEHESAGAGTAYAARGWEVPDFSEALFGQKRHEVALVIPVINEGDRIRRQLVRVRDAQLPVDVVIADGGSTDGSLEPVFIRQAGVRALLTKTGPGKLSAQLRMAYAWCLDENYTGIVTIDGNGKDGVEAVAHMVALLEQGYDYVQGSRYLPGGAAENTPLDRTIANRLIHAPLLSVSGKHWYTDTTNGFRAYSRHYLLDPRVRPFRDVFSRYELLFYLTVRAGQTGMRVGHVPVQRHYPADSPTPTKIAGFGSKIEVLKQTIDAALGRFTPPDGSEVHEVRQPPASQTARDIGLDTPTDSPEQPSSLRTARTL
jgi:dolichol-phosphate mannosyltransferase